MPALVEGDDGRLWVTKLRGAGQGTRALIAELVVGELARALGLPVPELAVVDAGRARSGAPSRTPRCATSCSRASGSNAGLVHLPGGARRSTRATRAGDRGRARLARRRARRVRDERRPHAAQPEPPLVGREALAHRSRRGAVLAPRLERRPMAGADAAVRRSSAITCCCPGRTTLAGGGRELVRATRRRDARARRSRSCPTTGSSATPELLDARARTGAAYLAWLPGAARGDRRHHRGGGACPGTRLATPSCASSRASSARSSSTSASSSSARSDATSAAGCRRDTARACAPSRPRRHGGDRAPPRRPARRVRGRGPRPAPSRAMSAVGALPLARRAAQHRRSRPPPCTPASPRTRRGDLYARLVDRRG